MSEDVSKYRHHESLEKQLAALEGVLSTAIAEFERDVKVRIVEIWLSRYGHHPAIRVEAEEKR